MDKEQARKLAETAMSVYQDLPNLLMALTDEEHDKLDDAPYESILDRLAFGLVEPLYAAAGES